MSLTIEVINLRSGKQITLSVESPQEAHHIEQDIFNGKIKLASEGPTGARIFNALSLLSTERTMPLTLSHKDYKKRATRKPPRNVSLMKNQDFSRLHQKSKG